MASTVVVVPYPGRSHIKCMMNLCKLLLAADHNLLITFVVTEEWLGYLQGEDNPPTIQFATIPNVAPLERDRAANMVAFLEAVQTKMEDPFATLLDRIGSPVSLIIADVLLDWPVEFGNRKNIPVALLCPFAASAFAVLCYFNLLVRNRHYPFVLSERGNDRLDYIPGIESIRLADIPAQARMKDRRLFNLFLRGFANVSRAQYLLINSVYELESGAVDAIKKEFTFPIYTFGPAIPFSDLQNSPSSPAIDTWLNSQPQNSVLYISFGSFLSVSDAQMDEIGAGLQQSGVSFLWVAREEAARLEQRFDSGGGGAGKVVPWCEQLRVLTHAAVGGFWTHCGWNSTLEGIHAGVPFVAFPIDHDQTTNRKIIVEDWKVGLDAYEEIRDGELLRSGEVCRLVRKLMDLQSGERKEIMGRVAELQKACLRAVADGGSSKDNLSSFLHDWKSSS